MQGNCDYKHIVLLMASKAGLRISELAYCQAGTCLGGYVVQGFSLKKLFAQSKRSSLLAFIISENIVIYSMINVVLQCSSRVNGSLSGADS